MARRTLQKGLTELGVLTGHPLAFLIVGLYAIGWLLFDRQSFGAHGVATLITWLMTLFIQRAEHRDTQAIQAKLDELLRAHGDARTDLTHLDEKTTEEIDRHRREAQAGDAAT